MMSGKTFEEGKMALQRAQPPHIADDDLDAAILEPWLLLGTVDIESY